MSRIAESVFINGEEFSLHKNLIMSWWIYKDDEGRLRKRPFTMHMDTSMEEFEMTEHIMNLCIKPEQLITVLPATPNTYQVCIADAMEITQLGYEIPDTRKDKTYWDNFWKNRTSDYVMNKTANY